MGLFTTTDDAVLEEARKLVVPGDRICPACKQSFHAAGPTLTTWNPSVGIEGHKCTHCGHVVILRRPSPDGL